MKPEASEPNAPPPESGAGRKEDAATRIPDRTREAGDRFREKTVQEVTDMRDRARDELGSTKQQFVDQIRGLGDALRATSEQLEQENQPLSRHARRAGERLDRAADYVRDSDARDLLDDAADFARRQPALFYGATFTAGLLAARFLKSSRNGGRRIERATATDESEFEQVPGPLGETTSEGRGAS